VGDAAFVEVTDCRKNLEEEAEGEVFRQPPTGMDVEVHAAVFSDVEDNIDARLCFVVADHSDDVGVVEGLVDPDLLVDVPTVFRGKAGLGNLLRQPP